MGGLALYGTSKSTLQQGFGNIIEVAERIKRPKIIEECFETVACAHDTDITLNELTTCYKILCPLHMGGAHEALTLIEGLWEVNGYHRRAVIFLNDIATDKLFH